MFLYTKKQMKNSIMININNKEFPILELSIPLTYIFSQYYIGGTTMPLGMVMTLFALAIHTLAHPITKIAVYKPLIILYSFMLVHDCLRLLFAPLAAGQIIVYSIITVLIIYSTSSINEEKLYKIWSAIGILVMIGIAYQSLRVYIYHTPISMINLFPFLETSTVKATALSLRPCSVFLESASYCSWITPLLYLALKRKSMGFAVIISISMLLSTSAIGMLMLFFCWGYTLLFQNNGMNKGIRFVSVLFVILAFIYALFNVGIFSSSLGRLYQLQNELMYGGGSSYRRLIAGYKIYGELPFFSKLFGIPYQTVQQLLLSGAVDYTKYYISKMSNDFGYVNTISRCMIIYGAFGLLIFAFFIVRALKDIDSKHRLLLVLIIISMFTQSAFFNNIFLLQFSTLLGISQMNNCETLIIKRNGNVY